jgi:hypothetical protein
MGERDLSHRDVCRYLVDSLRADGYTPVLWQISPAIWMDITDELRPTAIVFSAIGNVSLFGIPVDVSSEHMGIQLRLMPQS